MERWKINLYTIWFCQIICLMSFSFGLPFLPLYIVDLGVTEPDQIKFYTGLLFSATAVSMAIMSPIWGLAADRWGKKMMLLRAMGFAAVIVTAMGFVSSITQLVVLRFIQGIFTGTVTAAVALVASSTPSNRLSFSIGFLSSSTFIGTSAGPIIGGLLAEYAGYRPSFIVGGILMALDFFLVLFLVKEETQPQPVPGNKKEADKLPLLSLFTAFITVMLFILFISRSARTVFGPFLPLFIQKIRSGLGGVAKYTGIVNGITGMLTAVSGLTLSRLGDKYDRMRLLKILLLASVIFSIPLAFTNNLWAFTAVYGMMFYIAGSIEPLIISITTENTDPKRRGLLFGIQGLVGSGAMAAAPLLGSAVSIKYSIQAVLMLIPATFLIGLLSSVLIKNRRKNNTEEKLEVK